jgi:hypothetical protein
MLILLRSLLLLNYWSFLGCLESIHFRFLSIIFNVSIRFHSLAPRSEGG